MIDARPFEGADQVFYDPLGREQMILGGSPEQIRQAQDIFATIRSLGGQELAIHGRR